MKVKFQAAQDKMIRFILGYDSRQHLYVKAFLRASFLSVEKRYDYLSANLMYTIFYDQAPSSLIYVSLREFVLFIHMGQEALKWIT